MKRQLISIGFIAIILLSIITGCKIQSIDQYHKASEKNNIEDKLEVNADESVEADVEIDRQDAEKDLEINEEQQEENQQKRETKKIQNSESEKLLTIDKKDGSVNGENDRNKNSASNNTGQKSSKPSMDNNNRKYVTLTIRCDTILNNRDKLDTRLNSEQFIPSDGIILKKTKFELKDNESVFDILVKATRKYRIHMEYQGASNNQYNSVYIQGINNIYEFSCGELSGWMYNVNGNYPNIGADKYILKDGDNIEWRYTCDLGRDLGVTWIK